MYRLEVKVRRNYKRGKPVEWKTVAETEDISKAESLIPKGRGDNFRIVPFVPKRTYVKEEAKLVRKGFGDRLRKAMKETGLTIYDVAKNCDISVQSVCNYRTNTRRPTIKTAEKIADGLGVNLAFLVGDIL